jgi:hypothetical protein
MTMRAVLTATAILFAATAATSALAANTQSDFDSAFAAAVAAEKEAGALKNRWTTTEDALAAAKKAASTGDFDMGIYQAGHAEALAKASIAQANEQATAWRAVVIR